VTVRATDTRGQIDTESRTIHVPGPPKVMNARFVNDEPLSSKHPKLDPEDYTGQFKIDVALNGVDPGHVSTKFKTQRVNTSVEQKKRTTDSGYGLAIEQNFSTSYKGEIRPVAITTWHRGNNREVLGVDSGRTSAELSKPVVHLDLIDAQNRIGSLGATFDASESFDPDGSELDFEWDDVNSSSDWTGPTKQLSPRKLILLTITDEQNQSNKTGRLLDWFTPGLQTPEPQNSKPVFPQDTVTYRVRTNEYELSQAVYEQEELGKAIDFELVSDVGNVGGHIRYAQREKGGSFDQARPEGIPDSFIFHEWMVWLPANEFMDGDQPTVRIQSTRQSEAYREVELPTPEIYNQIGTSTDLTEFNVKYVEEHPEYEVERTARSERKEALEQMGFNLYTVRQTGTEYHTEKRVKTEPAEWKTVTRDFDTKFQRQIFIDERDEWQANGSSEQREERTVADHVWRDSKSGPGEFTGDTRRERVERAEVETLREYEYEQTYEVTVTDEEEREKCMPNLGCWTYTVETTETETRTTEYDYWSSRPRNPTHHWTGDTKIRTVEPAEYERQYEFRVENTETYWEQVYHASTAEKVQPAQYEWKDYKMVTSERAASIMTTASDIRVASTEPTREWTLRRTDGTYNRTTDVPEQPSRVVETRMTATADIEARFLPPGPGVRSEIVTKNRTVETTQSISRFVPTEEAKNVILEKANRTYADNH